jgi:hypothetical protein
MSSLTSCAQRQAWANFAAQACASSRVAASMIENRVRGLAHRGHLLVGDVVHRVGIERDQVPRHP